MYERKCNVCGYEGYFKRFGRFGRIDSRCPQCSSLERHRLLALAFQRGRIPVEIGPEDKVLHFAAETCLQPMLREKFSDYKTADLYIGADLKLDLENIDLPSDSHKLVIANHVLEHVDDRKASQELARILEPGGLLVCMVPIIEGWDKTFEDEKIDTYEARAKYYGQYNHIRYYGRDFRERIGNGGLELISEITAEGYDVIEYGLIRGEKVFVFRKEG